ncbi:hypothetical protein [Chryseobacterium sp.]|uniref:hypothetical protein n=1 Tax=Chryseobacterium sp. TaxID=1871047 RepID=UPI00289C487C|nr:hypothetical protein [Chryseobacterium sp.]
MKKIFLGLFLTVGVSGFALAGSVENANNPSSSNLCKSENSIGSEDVEESLRRNCATQYFVRSYNCDDSMMLLLVDTILTNVALINLKESLQ